MGSQVHSKFVVESDNLFDECESYAGLQLEDLTESLVEAKLECLEEDWKSVRAAYEAVYSTDEIVISTQFKELAKTRFRECREKYQVTKANMNDTLKQARSSTNVSQNGPSHSSSVNNSTFYPNNNTYDMTDAGIRVPACEIKTFDGTLEDWPAFRDLFNVLYHNNPRVSTIEKYLHLVSKTTKKAAAIIHGIPVSEKTYMVAYNALQTRFENKKILIEMQVKALFDIEPAKYETSDDLDRIRSSICDCLSILSTLGQEYDQWDPILIHLCTTKLPLETLTAWEQSFQSYSRIPTWKQMETFLANRCQVVERITGHRNQKEQLESGCSSSTTHNGNVPVQNDANRVDRASGNQGSGISNKGPKCKLCNEHHNLRICPKFSDFSVKQRTEYVQKNNICSNCLSWSHQGKECKSVFRCTQCKNRHHSLLHVNQNSSSDGRNVNSSERQNVNSFYTESIQVANNSDQERPSFSGASGTDTQIHLSINSDDTLLPTAMVQLKHLGEIFSVRAMIDSGAKRSYVSDKIRRRLNLVTQPANFRISGLAETVVANATRTCDITLYSDKMNVELNAKAIVLPRLTSLMPSSTISNPDLTEISDLKLADPNFLVASQVDMVLGCDIIPFILRDGTRSNVLGNMTARESVYGWFIYGPLEVKTVSLVAIDTTEEKAGSDEISSQLKRFWETEEVPLVHVQSEEEKFCEELYERTTYRRDDGRYVVRLPFKQDFPQSIYLASSRYAAKMQYLHMESKLEKSPELHTTYGNILREYVDLGHMQLSESEEICSDGNYFSYYLPHHAVFRPESASTKVRVVFNGSRKTKSSFSLNDVLHRGPVLQSDLMTIILNWRTYRHVFNGDIEKMYRQIVIHEADRPYQRILFRDPASGKLEDYELSTVTFGVNCAPYLAIRTLMRLADDTEAENPLSSRIIKRETYVDDILSGGHTIASAVEAQKQLCDVLGSAGFPLRKITANHPELLVHVPQENLLNSDFLKFDDSSSTKTLGIRWNALSDTFSYNVDPIAVVGVVTKRHILSSVAKLFDPAGWLTPIIVQAKMLLQELWQDGVDWDDAVKPQTVIRWNEFVEDLRHIEAIRIPRWVNFHPENRTQIHGFCDASERAYCATLYIRSETATGRFSHLLVAKSKVAPLQKLSLPRLELCGAVLLSKLVKHVVSSLTLPDFSLHLWTDSTIVLAWLQKHPSSWKTYVANRTTKIIENVGNANWRHVSSGDNPADLGTRVFKPQDLIKNSLWWHGPMWLLNSPDDWPQSEPPTSAPLEERRRAVPTCTTACHLTLPTQHTIPSCNAVGDDSYPPSRCQKDRLKRETGDEFYIINRFTTYHRALRAISYMIRFSRITLKRTGSDFDPKLSSLSHVELNAAKLVLIRLTQRAYYSRELDDLSNSRLISKKSSLITLNPFIDDQGLLRVNGRLVNSDLSYNERFPIIIPSESNFCEMLLSFIHINLMHADVSLMMNMVRCQFYIPYLKRAVKKCITGCLTCVRYKQRVLSQIMSALPVERSSFSLPFTFAGVDFAGPFQVKAGTLRNSPYTKGYACVFVCFATRAIHLEACSSLSSDAFLAAFTRFVGRRGLPKRMMSDNGTNFVGASKELLAQYQVFLRESSNDIVEKYAVHGFEWKFIPPSAPHMGGLWEAGVKSFKAHFRKVVGNQKFNYEEFSTLLVRIEGVLNSRPLSPMSEDPGDLQALTPGHFLRGAPLMFTPEMPINDPNISFHNRWEKLKALHHRFAQRWRTEYLQELHKRYKWQHPQRELQVDDFVIIKDEQLPPNEWSLGRIEAVHRGPDLRVRTADIRTQSGLTTRPIVKLCWLPDKLLSKLEESEPDPPTSQEDECVICINARATMQTSPCGHRVVCRRCFVKTIQSAVAQRLLPLRCVICRARVNRLTSSSGTWRIQESASSYSMGAKSWASVGVTADGVAASASSYSMNDAHSGHHAFHMHPTSRYPRSPNGRVSQSDSLYSMSSTGSSSAASVFSKTSSISSELCSPASPISPTQCSYNQTSMILNNHLAPPTPSISPHSPTSTSGSGTSQGSLSPKDLTHSHHSGCPTGCSGAIPRKPLKSLSNSSSSGSCSSTGSTFNLQFTPPSTHTYPGRRHTKGRIVDLQNRLPPIKEFRSPAKVPHPSPVHISNPRFRYNSYTKPTTHGQESNAMATKSAKAKEPSSPPKRPMNIHISASHNTLAPPPLKAGGSKISPLTTKHQMPKSAYNVTAKEKKSSTSSNSCSDSNKNNINLKISQTKLSTSANKTTSSSMKSSSSSSSSSGTSTHHHHHAQANSTLTTSFTTSKSFPLFCSNNNHKEKLDNKKNETVERRKEEKLKLKAEKEARKEEKRLAKEEERLAKLMAKEEKKKCKKEAKELLIANDGNCKN